MTSPARKTQIDSVMREAKLLRRAADSLLKRRPIEAQRKYSEADRLEEEAMMLRVQG